MTAKLTASAVRKLVAGRGVEVRGSGRDWEIECSTKAAKTRVQKAIPGLGGYKTGYGAWVLSQGYNAGPREGDYCTQIETPRSRAHAAWPPTAAGRHNPSLRWASQGSGSGSDGSRIEAWTAGPWGILLMHGQYILTGPGIRGAGMKFGTLKGAKRAAAKSGTPKVVRSVRAAGRKRRKPHEHRTSAHKNPRTTADRRAGDAYMYAAELATLAHGYAKSPANARRATEALASARDALARAIRLDRAAGLKTDFQYIRRDIKRAGELVGRRRNR